MTAPRWAFLQGFQVEQGGRPYLDRLRIISTPWFSVFLHRIHAPDADRFPHDHPWPFASLVLCGGYDELVYDLAAAGDGPYGLEGRLRTRRRGSLRTMRLTQAHQIIRIRGVLWTLVVTGRRRESWRFWTPDGPVDWTEYDAAGTDTDSGP